MTTLMSKSKHHRNVRTMSSARPLYGRYLDRRICDMTRQYTRRGSIVNSHINDSMRQQAGHDVSHSFERTAPDAVEACSWNAPAPCQGGAGCGSPGPLLVAG